MRLIVFSFLFILLGCFQLNAQQTVKEDLIGEFYYKSDVPLFGSAGSFESTLILEKTGRFKRVVKSNAKTDVYYGKWILKDDTVILKPYDYYDKPELSLYIKNEDELVFSVNGEYSRVRIEESD